jgi:cell division protein FtsB
MSIGEKMFRKRAVTFLILVVGGLLIFSLFKNIFRLLRAEKRIDEAQDVVTRLRDEQQTLSERKEHLESEAFIEEQARNKLNMAREGEAVVVLSPEIGETSEKKEEAIQKLPVWQQWLEVFEFR